MAVLLSTLKRRMALFEEKSMEYTNFLREEIYKLFSRMQVNNEMFETEVFAELKKLQEIKEEYINRLKDSSSKRKQSVEYLQRTVYMQFEALRDLLEIYKNERNESLWYLNEVAMQVTSEFVNGVERNKTKYYSNIKAMQLLRKRFAKDSVLLEEYAQNQAQEREQLRALIKELQLRVRREVSETKWSRQNCHEELLNYVEDCCNYFPCE